MPTIEQKLEKVEYINNKNLNFCHRGFTGSITIHWKEGEIMKEEKHESKNVILEK
ncbi:MAG TPA: hypothetical protein VMV77_21300 [Bacteroidales bacterium]|nr:hypothetical protein [Bacteroidales bacterium]